jgi:hypothetical protein
LKNYLSALAFSSRSSRYLRNELIRTLVCSKVGKMQTHIRIHYSYKRYVGKIVTFCYHLRSNEYGRFLLRERFQNFNDGVLVARGIVIHSEYSFGGKHFF